MNESLIRWRPRSDDRRRYAVEARLALARQAVAEYPRAAAPLYTLALDLLRLEQQQEAIRLLERALDLAAPTAAQHAAYARALVAVGRAAEALAALGAHGHTVSTSPALLVARGAALLEMGRTGEALADFLAALAIDSRNMDAAHGAGWALTRLEAWERLIAFHDDQARSGAVTIPTVLAKLAGLVGLGRLAEAADLVDAASLVSIREIDPPMPYTSIAAFNADLQSDIERAGKVRLSRGARLRLTGGVQVEDLHVGSSPAMAALFDSLEAAVGEYISSRSGHAARLVRQLAPAAASLECWALILERGDAQDEHVHAYSSVAGVYYVAAPQAVLGGDNERGCLIIPSGFPTPSAVAPAALRIKPLPGRLVLFPGHMPHRTAPTDCDGRRISIAFDVVPASDAVDRAGASGRGADTGSVA